MHSAPTDHVRGDLVAPAIEWLGQLVAERHRPMQTLDTWLRGSERTLLHEPPSADHWIPLHVGRRLVEALVEVHGGRMPAVLRELGRRSVPRVAALDGAPVERLAIRLDGLIRLGHWRRATPRLPGDLLELDAHRPCEASTLAWLAGLIACATPRGMHGATMTAVRTEAPGRYVFVRCAY